MAIPTIHIGGHVRGPGGVTPISGTIMARLSGHASALDGSETVRVLGERSFKLGAAGLVSMDLEPNDAMTPSGLYWLVSYDLRLPGGGYWRGDSEMWQVPSGGALDIGSVPRLDVVPGVAVTTHEAVQASVLAAATASQVAAAASEAAAASSAGLASGAEAGAISAKTLAEAARDAAATAGATYANTAAGIAAVADGANFYVPSGDTLIRYQRSGAAAVEVGRLPSGAAVSALQAALTPSAADTVAGHWYVTDSAGRVLAYIDSASGLRLAGIEGTVQSRVQAVSRVGDVPGAVWYVLDSSDHVVAYLAADGGLMLAGISGSIQALATSAETKGTKATSYPASLTGAVVLPSSFTPMGSVYRGQERFIWSGSPPTLRPNSTRVTGYPFDWSTDPVTPSKVRRARALLSAPTTWTYEALTVNDPGSIYATRQFRDLSWVYDRALGKYWFAVNAISSQATGFLASDFPIASSSDGLVIDHVGLVNVIPGAPTKIWSPEWFIDDDGTVYIIVSANTGTGGTFRYHLLRCTTPSTMVTWVHVAELTGTAFPTNGSGSVNMIDPWMYKRDGVYYVAWKQETASGGSSLIGQLGIAWSTNLTGPFDAGQAFSAPGPTAMRGEGGNAVELPAGGAYRFRWFFDDYLNLFAGVMAYADTNDFTTFTTPADTGLATYARHTTFLIGD